MLGTIAKVAAGAAGLFGLRAAWQWKKKSDAEQAARLAAEAKAARAKADLELALLAARTQPRNVLGNIQQAVAGLRVVEVQGSGQAVINAKQTGERRRIGGGGDVALSARPPVGEREPPPAAPPASAAPPPPTDGSGSGRRK